jgi:two-component system chemotaxis response regulator CheY
MRAGFPQTVRKASAIFRRKTPGFSRRENPNEGALMDVLIVDDSAAIRKILKRVLQQADIPLGQVYEAGDGVEAIEQLKTQTVQLILSDINMPNMDGLQFLGKLKASAEWKDVPVVMITTEGGQQKVVEAVERGAVGYVRKPFSAEQIKEKLIGII